MKTFAIAAAVIMTVSVSSALSQPYPTRTVRIIVPAAAGGGTDIVARLIAQKLTDGLGRTVIVDNRVGGDGTVGTEAMAKAAADGYTIGMAQPGPMTIARTLSTKLPYDPERDFAPVINANSSPNVLAIHPSMPARSMKELIALAKVRPLNVGIGNLTSVQHLLTEMMNHEAGIRTNNIAYKGGLLAATDVVGGHVDFLWSVVSVVMPFLQNGRLRPLAVANEKRVVFLAQVPTTGESGWPKIVGTAWNGVVAPAGTPQSVIDLLNAEIAKSLLAPDVKERYANLAMEAIGGTPEEFGAFMRAETAKWAQVIKSANINRE